MPITIGVIEHWENEVDGLKNDQDGLNEYYRQFPRTEQHAFRDETKDSLFNLVKIYEQIDYNEDINNAANVTQGGFQWENGVRFSKVIFLWRGERGELWNSQPAGPARTLDAREVEWMAGV